MNFIQVKIRGTVNFTLEVRPKNLRKFVKFSELLKEMCLLFMESQNSIRKIERGDDSPFKEPKKHELSKEKTDEREKTVDEKSTGSGTGSKD